MDAILIGARAVIKYLKKGCGLADSAAAAPLKALMKVNHNSLPQFSFNFEIIKDSAASVTCGSLIITQDFQGLLQLMNNLKR